MSTKKLTTMAIFTTLALLMFLIEGLLPPLIPIVGVKIGLANVITLIALIVLGAKEAYVILVIRCLLASVFGNMSAIMYAVPAGLLSLTVEYILYRFTFPRLTLTSISFTAALVHNATQVLIASLVAQTNLALLLPFSLIGSLAAGCFIGIVAHYTIKSLPKSLYLNL